MSVTWPSSGSFPQAAYTASHVETPESMTIETPMDTVNTKVRKRSTAAPEEFQIEVRVTKAQVTTFHTWWTSTANANYGAAKFIWVHPRTNASTTTERCWIRAGSLQYIPISGDLLWKITFRMVIDPA